MATLADIQAASWYPKVKAAMDNAGVPLEVWASTILVEDNTLNPSEYNGSGTDDSYGLFQIKIGNAAKGYGLGQGYTPSQLDDPATSAGIAAQQMGQFIQAADDTTAPLSTQLQDVERAGWNGSLSEDSQRQAMLASVLNSEGLKYTAPESGGVYTAQATPTATTVNATNPLTALTNSFAGFGQGVAAYGIAFVLILIGGIIFALSFSQVRDAVGTAGKAAAV